MLQVIFLYIYLELLHKRVQVVGPQAHVVVHESIILQKISKLCLELLLHVSNRELTVGVKGAVNCMKAKAHVTRWRGLSKNRV